MPGLRPAASHSLDLSPCRLALKDNFRKKKTKKREITKNDKRQKYAKMKMMQRDIKKCKDCEENDISRKSFESFEAFEHKMVSTSLGSLQGQRFLDGFFGYPSCKEFVPWVISLYFSRMLRKNFANLQMSGDWKSFPESVQASAAFSRGLLRVLCALTKAGANLGILILTWILECITGAATYNIPCSQKLCLAGIWK